MEDIRKSIKNKYEDLEQLEDYERLLKHLNGEGSGHWWEIVTPGKKVKIYTSESRKNLKIFIMDEIIRIKSEIGIRD